MLRNDCVCPGILNRAMYNLEHVHVISAKASTEQQGMTQETPDDGRSSGQIASMRDNTWTTRSHTPAASECGHVDIVQRLYGLSRSL